jgi:hypothetical protein
MTRRIIFLRMHERAPWESRNVYNRDFNSVSNIFLKGIKFHRVSDHFNIYKIRTLFKKNYKVGD